MVLYISLPRSSYTNASNEYSLEAKNKRYGFKAISSISFNYSCFKQLRSSITTSIQAMFTYVFFSISIINLMYLINNNIIIARSVGEIIKATVNAPCSNEYCTFYKGSDARLEFTFKLRKMV